MQYNHKEIEENWQKFWADNQTFKATNPAQSSDKGMLINLNTMY